MLLCTAGRAGWRIALYSGSTQHAVLQLQGRHLRLQAGLLRRKFSCHILFSLITAAELLQQGPGAGN